MEMSVDEILAETVKKKASDLHITVGVPPMARVNGELIRVGESIIMPEDAEKIVREILSKEEYEKFEKSGDIDLSISKEQLGRFRVNAFVQRGMHAAVLRTIPIEIPNIDSLGLPDGVKEIAKKKRGLFLVTGPTGSGKSTTLAALINLINTQETAHIITLEDPIEYIHPHKRSIVNQREIGSDTDSYASGLKAALREDPDAILVGEMRDLETISVALTAAETGHLVFSTVHTIGAAKTIDRVVDIFPPHQQEQIRVQLSSILIGVLSQVLIKRLDTNKRIGAFEFMLATPAIKNLIREKKVHQIMSIMQTSANAGMITMDAELVKLYKQGIINKENVLSYCYDTDFVKKSIL